LAGSGTNYGTADLAGPLFPGDTNVVGTITLGGLTLESGATLYLDLGTNNTVGGEVNDLIQVNGDLTINGNSVVINPHGLLKLGVPYRLINYTGTLTMNGGLSVSGPNGQYIFTVDTSTPGEINLVVSGGPPVWDGGSVSDSDWSDAANWGGTSIVPYDSLYFAGDNRLNNTNDTGAGTSYGDIDFNTGSGAFVLNGNPLTLEGNINNNSTNLQTLNPSISLADNPVFNAGTAGLVLNGGVTNASSTAYTIHLQGVRGTLAGPLQSSSAGLQENLAVTLDYNAGESNSWSIVGNNTSYLTNLTVSSGSITLGTGSDSPSLSITNSSAYALEVGDTTNVTSVFTMNSGTLAATYSNEQPLEMGALGSTGIFNMNGGLLTLSGKYIQIGDTGGQGIFNQSGGTVNADVSGDFILGNQVNASGVLNISGGTFNIPNGAYVGFRGSGVWNISSTGSVVVGTMNMTRNNSDSPNASGTVNLNGGTLVMNQETMGNAGTGQTGAINFNGGVLTAAGDSTSFISPPVSPSVLTAAILAGGAIINDGGYAITISQPLVHDSSLGTTNDGGLTKLGSGTLALTATNTYTGQTTVSNGTLQVDGVVAGNGVDVENGTLSGVGSITAPVAIETVGTLSPGDNAIGTLSIADTLTLSGTNQMDLNKTNSILSSDLITNVTTLTLGGTLQLNITGNALANGDSFKLYSAGSITGSFASIEPATPGTGLAWDTSALDSQGILKVKNSGSSGPTIGAVSVSGGNVMFTVTGGNAGATLHVLTSTNLALPLSDWTPVTTNQFDNTGNFSFTNAVSGQPQQFFIIQEQ
jgi:autotransporter-associated beta strand protein